VVPSRRLRRIQNAVTFNSDSTLVAIEQVA
jgi:hypothetical protein